MAIYTLHRAHYGALMIREQEYATGPKVRFTNFTSCIGIVVKNGASLTGVHLVMDSLDDNSMFGEEGVTNVIQVLGVRYEKGVIVGFTGSWSRIPAYTSLKQKLPNLTEDQREYPGYRWGAEIDENNEIAITAHDAINIGKRGKWLEYRPYKTFA